MLPVLIYRSTDVCFNTLNYMIDCFADALNKAGIDVCFFDAQTDGGSGLSRILGREYLAVIGFQTAAFGVFITSANSYLNDIIPGPKINILFDHPLFIAEECCLKCPRDYYVMTHDADYIDFVKRYYPQVKDAMLFPPGGVEASGHVQREKTEDIVFIGSYFDYRKYFRQIKSIEKSKRKLANQYISMLKKNPRKSQEEVLRILLEQNLIKLTDSEFLDLLDSFKWIILCLNAYYREKTVKTILESEIHLVVYDERWRNSPFSDNPYLTIKASVTPEESLRVYQSSKLSLNVMSGHKAGFTERIANSMLNRSVVVSDVTTVLEEQYENGKELILFELDKMDELPARIKELLRDNERRKEIAERAYRRAISEDTWIQRAKLFLEYIYEIREKVNVH